MTNQMENFVYLAVCAVTDRPADPARLNELDLEQLYRLAKSQTLRAAVCMALESAGIRDEKFIIAKNKAIRRTLLMDFEREKLFQQMTEHKVWFSPLKGIVLKDLYPKLGMREMVDNDILFDPDGQKAVYDIMTAAGYQCREYNRSNHDVYRKPPVMSFEMHTTLFGTLNEVYYNYFLDAASRLKEAPDSPYHRIFSDEDFYIYITCHEHKHFSGGGTGFRALTDCYAFLHAKGDEMDFEYISKELAKMDIAEYEKTRRALVQKVFSHIPLSELSQEELEMLGKYVNNGSYGTIENFTRNRMEDARKKGGKLAKPLFLLRRLFPNPEVYFIKYPKYRGKKLMYPILWCRRIIDAIRFPNKTKRELQELKKIK